MSSAAMTQRITEMSPRFLARMAAVLGVGELALGFWLLVFGVNVERWKEQAAQLSVRSMKLVETES